MREDMDLEMKVKESELLPKYLDQKEKIRLSNEKERREHEEKIRKKVKRNGSQRKRIRKKER